MPRAAVDRLNAAMRKVLQEPAVRARLEGAGATIIASTPEDFGKEIKGLYELLQRVVVERKITPE